MRSISRSIAVVAALLLLGASAAPAQHPQTRKGFWIGFGVGWGSYEARCGLCGGGREGSYTGYLKMGGTVNPHLLLGGEIIGWSKTQNGATLTAGNTTLTAYVYPEPAGGFFLSGGLGFSTIDASASGSNSNKSGPGVSIGLGYDLRIAANTSITPVANWVWGHPESGFSQNFFHVGFGVTFH